MFTKRRYQYMIQYISIISLVALGIISAKCQDVIRGSFAPLMDYRVAIVNQKDVKSVTGEYVKNQLKQAQKKR